MAKRDTKERDRKVSRQDLDQLSSLFRLLSDKTRLSILLRLAEGEQNVTTLCEGLGLPQPTISHHLGVLRINNIVGHRRYGKQIYYNLNGHGGTQDHAIMEFAVHNLAIQVKPRSRHSSGHGEL